MKNNNLLLIAILVIAAGLLYFTGVGNQQNEPDISIGMYAGIGGGELELQEYLTETELGHVLIFQTIDDLDYQEVKYVLDMGKRPIVNIEFFGTDPVLPGIINGDYDSLIIPFLKELKEDGRPVSIRPLHEGNGNWYPWGVFYDNGAPATNIPLYKTAFIHVSNLIRANAPNAKVQFNINHENGYGDPTPLSSFYPGDNYVDKVVITNYNRCGTDQYHLIVEEFRDSFSGPYNEMKSVSNKPMGVAETSSTSYCGVNKPQWIMNMFHDIPYYYPEVDEITWFNRNKVVNGVEWDWGLNTVEDQQAFHDAVLNLRKG